MEKMDGMETTALVAVEATAGTIVVYFSVTGRRRLR